MWQAYSKAQSDAHSEQFAMVADLRRQSADVSTLKENVAASCGRHSTGDDPVAESEAMRTLLRYYRARPPLTARGHGSMRARAVDARRRTAPARPLAHRSGPTARAARAAGSVSMSTRYCICGGVPRDSCARVREPKLQRVSEGCK